MSLIIYNTTINMNDNSDLFVIHNHYYEIDKATLWIDNIISFYWNYYFLYFK